ncbi:MAG: DNA primase [Aeromonadales bacterium]|nr:DNA primase [Aeromonadales bacterium]
MPFIKKSYIIEKLLPNVAIEKLIGQYVTLKKSGASYMCCCPFHNEKTPSCQVTPSKQMFYCYGCKAHGNAIDFIMKYKNLSFVEAVEELSQFAAIPVEYDENSKFSKTEVDKYKEYYELMDRCASLFTKFLNSPEGAQGLDYFKNARGLTSKNIVESRLGFAPRDSKLFINAVCKKASDKQALVDLGMLITGNYGLRSMYRNRVMIPIFDKRGRIISFGGRTMGDDKPKYMNTKETPIYKKRKELFGLYETLKANNNRPSRIVVVEGYMDVISVRQAGCSYAVASLGTATTAEQLNEMFRYTDKVICCYDGDSAGRHAAWHALETVTPVLQESKEIYFAFLPEEHDPDSLVREKGLSAFSEFLDNAISYAEFLVLHKSNSYNLNDPNELSTMVNDTINFIKTIPLASMQNVSLLLLSKVSGMSQPMLYEMLKNAKNTETNKPTAFEKEFSYKEKTVSQGEGIFKTPMRKLMAFVIQQPIVVSSVYHEFALDTFITLCKRLNVRGSEQLEGLLNMILETPDITAANFIEVTRQGPYETIVRTLMSAPLNISFENGSKELKFEEKIDYFSDIMSKVLEKPLKDRAEVLKIQLAQGNTKVLNEYTALQKEILSADV